jgi:hypothetical protein
MTYKSMALLLIALARIARECLSTEASRGAE